MQCRTCGGSAEDGVSLLEQDHLFQLISDNLQAQMGPQFPTMMCQRCIMEVCHWQWFRNRISNSRQKFQQILDSLAPAIDNSTAPGDQLDSLFDCPPADTSSSALPECHVLLHRLLDCEQCDQVFTSVTELVLHRNLIHQSTYQDEQAKASGPRKWKYKCSKCQQKFLHHEYMKRHVKYFHGDNPMGKTFTNKQGIKVFKCLLCHYESINSSSKLIDHISSNHTKSRPFQCDVCVKCFSSSITLHRHKQVHSGQTWSCEICSAKFALRWHLKRHTLQVHSQSVKCKICGKIYKCAFYLSQHMNYMHATEKPFACNLCDKAFSKQFYLNKHYKIVHSNLVFCCESCNYSSNFKSALKHHIQNKHSKNPVFSCSKCPAKFRTKNSYNHHMQRVHATGCFQCEMCAVKFKCKNYLNQHMKRTHIGLVLHCTQCKYATRRKRDLRLHINNIHAGKS